MLELIISLFVLVVLGIIFYDEMNRPKWEEAHRKYETHLISVGIDGEIAFWNGILEDKVPYEAGTDEHRSWIEGWEKAECENYREKND